ncbi:hypothetical protein Amet_2419 [Alkaliphilus metalliredigens QYMF]|uniref:Phage protein n=1 Tax=Alkaliphilus metalliredigens (strain QYMF) TaxID=293826 RepID=A6TQV5_ALKMQ|nr:hypothetical protein [Alkaliphilus metalliredigens]ABR48573.1 hypothetical protein Amet_2419 [Alkaliphilus metalliredigens QYMF]
MITLKDIKIAITTRLKNTLDIEITSKDIKEGFKRPSFFIQLDNIRKSAAGVDQVKRELTVRIYYFPSDRYQYSIEILDIQEQLEEIFDTKLKVIDRYLNIDEIESITTDGVLQLYFDIAYEEGREIDEVEVMEELYLKE